MGFVEGWVVTHDGETLRTGFRDDMEAMKWLHRRHSYSVDHAVRHEGYDIVLVEDGKVKWSYKRDVLGREKKGRPKRMSGAKDWDPRTPWSLAEWKTFFDAYLEAALWAETDPASGEPLDKNHSPEDFAPETRVSLKAEAESFLRDHWDDVSDELERAGHDFWLTRQGHGAGFWDGDWPKDVGKRLTEASKRYGEVTLYVGDDGMIHV